MTKILTTKKVEIANGTLICPGCGCSLLTPVRVEVSPGVPRSAVRDGDPWIDLGIYFQCGAGCETGGYGADHHRYRLAVTTYAYDPDVSPAVSSMLMWVIEKLGE